MILFPEVMSNPGSRRNGSSIKIRLTGKKKKKKKKRDREKSLTAHVLILATKSVSYKQLLQMLFLLNQAKTPVSFSEGCSMPKHPVFVAAPVRVLAPLAAVLSELP